MPAATKAVAIGMQPGGGFFITGIGGA